MQHRPRPGEERHRVDVRIAVLGVGSGRVDIGNGVVRVVLVGPPRDGEALGKISPEVSHHVSDATIGKDLVVEDFVAEPAALLEKHAENNGGGSAGGEVGPRPAVEDGDQVGRKQCQAKRRCLLVGVVQRRRVEETHGAKLGAKGAISTLELNLFVRL